MRALSLIFGLLLSLSVAQASAQVADKPASTLEIGTVTEVSGVAVIKRGKETINVVLGLPVQTNDRVETKAGRVRIKFKDNTTILITESSSVTLDDFMYDPKNKSGQLSIRGSSGTIRYTSGNIAHNNPNAVKINTPTAAIAVRGTDFVMSVNETGASLIMLMPSCEIESKINLSGITCTAGAIDVETLAGSVSMNRPYQATLVETNALMPTTPVIVDLNGAEISNNLMIAPPQTYGGTTVIQAARNAALKTGDLIKAATDAQSEQISSTNNSNVVVSRTQETQTVINFSELKKDKPKENTNDSSEPGNPHVIRLMARNSAQQVGWMYEDIGTTNRNYTGIVLPMDTKVQVTVSQDNLVSTHSFGGVRPVGSITVIQSYR
jgi:hypothetical protein